MPTVSKVLQGKFHFMTSKSPLEYNRACFSQNRCSKVVKQLVRPNLVLGFTETGRTQLFSILYKGGATVSMELACRWFLG